MSKLKESSEHFCQTQRESCNPDIPCMLSFINVIFRVKLQLWIISTVRSNYVNVNTLYFLQRLVLKRCICEVFWHISSAPGSVSHFLCLIVQATLLRYLKAEVFDTTVAEKCHSPLHTGDLTFRCSQPVTPLSFLFPSAGDYRGFKPTR